MTDEKSLNKVIVYDGERDQWEYWSEKYLARGGIRGYRKIVLCTKDTVGYDRIPKESEIAAIKAKLTHSDDEKAILALADLNTKAYMELLCSMNSKTNRGKVAFRLVKNCRSSDYPEGNVKLAWDRLVAKFAPKNTPSLLKLKRDFENSSLAGIQIDPEDWISELEGICIEIEAINQASAVSEKDLLLHVLNNLPEEYDVTIEGLESKLEASGDEKLTLETLRDKLDARYNIS